jgi:hypothetical protein
MTYQPKVYRKQGGDEIVVASGGKITIESGGELELQSGSTLDLGDGLSAPGDIALADGKMIIGDGTGFGTAVTPTGDVTVTNLGVTAIGAGKVTRAMQATEVAKLAMSIPIPALRHTSGVPLTAAETAGGFNFSLASHVWLAQAEITDNETEVSVVHGQVTLPPEYVDGGTITVRLPVSIVKTGSAVNNGSTVDVAVYKQASGAVGSDLSTTTAAATFAAVDTWYDKDFVITPTGLIAGDVLNLEITSSIVDSEAGAGTLRLNMGPPQILLDVKA